MMLNEKRGKFMSLEGIEGAGKTSILNQLQAWLGTRDDVIFTREPGGTDLGEALRDVLLHHAQTKIAPYAELYMIFAARAQHLQEKILPALAQGKHVISDRYRDSTLAYQIGGRGLDGNTLTQIEASFPDFVLPDHTLYLDVNWDESARRRQHRASSSDRFEKESEAFFKKVRDTYLKLVQDEPGRVILINTMQSEASVFDEVKGHLASWLV